MTYRTVTVEDLYPDVSAYKRHSLYVYSVTNNPDGAGDGTAAKYIGTTENYSQAADLWMAAQAAASAIYGDGGHEEVGLCIEENSSELLRRKAEEFRQAPSGFGPYARNWADKPHRVLYDAAKLLEEIADGKHGLHHQG